MDFFNIYSTEFEALNADFFGGSKVEGRVLHMSGDQRHLAVASRYPDGVRFRYGAAVDYQEVFYVVKGEGSRTFPDGTTHMIREGDLIFVRPGIDVEYIYSPGFIDVAFFWSDRPLDPALTQTASGKANGMI